MDYCDIYIYTSVAKICTSFMMYIQCMLAEVVDTWRHCYLESTGNPGHQTQTDEDRSQEQDKEVKPHVRSGVCLQRHHTVLPTSKRRAQVLEFRDTCKIEFGKFSVAKRL